MSEVGVIECKCLNRAPVVSPRNMGFQCTDGIHTDNTDPRVLRLTDPHCRRVEFLLWMSADSDSKANLTDEQYSPTNPKSLAPIEKQQQSGTVLAPIPLRHISGIDPLPTKLIEVKFSCSTGVPTSISRRLTFLNPVRGILKSDRSRWYLPNHAAFAGGEKHPQQQSQVLDAGHTGRKLAEA
ncbi:hypothetical protein T265_01443 [Opisthorchis viverrini]|uniref:Uncharacterized protein n=1 Tax=Opisthorchis viverrini TaxID=6198 RepID=A0A074ZYN3_OPIVI|nr:hypothetical protein T265_01443 [Opisthorchis viverrini]KER32573.1 hypothetical protein T265_01443 [Opisthorchis viverrini]